MTDTQTPESLLSYAHFTLEQLEALPEHTIVAMTWPGSPDPDLFRRSDRHGSHWAVLTAAENYDWERWTHGDLHSEHALYAVVYQPAP